MNDETPPSPRPAPSDDPVVTGGSPAPSEGMASTTEPADGRDLGGGEGGVDAGTDDREPPSS